MRQLYKTLLLVLLLTYALKTHAQDLTINNNGTYTVAAGDVLTLTNVTMWNNSILNVFGDLTITGTLTANNNVFINVTGTLVIEGNVEVNNNGIMDIDGDVTVDGDFDFGNGEELNVDGNLNVGGDFEVGNNGDLLGSGTIDVGGTTTLGTNTTIDPNLNTNWTLPVDLVSFTAEATMREVVLEWSTASEHNSNYFIVQRSVDGQTFENAFIVSAAGNSSHAINYTLTDYSAPTGIVYYRLKQVDYDGAYEIFPLISVYYQNPYEDTHKLYPNPVDNTAYIQFTDEYRQPVYIYVVSQHGLQMDKLKVDNPRGQTLELPVSNYSPGLYYIHVLGKGIDQSLKMIKQ